MTRNIINDVRNAITALDTANLSLKAIHQQLQGTLLNDKGLLLGVDSVRKTQFSDRSMADIPEKESLARYLLRDLQATGAIAGPSVSPLTAKSCLQKALFVESGSTFSPLISGFAAAVLAALPQSGNGKRTPLQTAAKTNSMLALTAWVNLLQDVCVEPGTFRDAYYGFFPFSNVGEKLNVNREAEAYSMIRRDVSECDRVFATCSRFSLLAGPIVGSRANAVFKHAMYSGLHDNQDFVLVFALTKLIPMSSEPAKKNIEPSCFCVLERPGWNRAVARFEAWNDWHLNWLKANEGVQPSIGPRFENEVKDARKPSRWETLRFDTKWLDVARSVTVAVGLGALEHAKSCYRGLKHEVDLCNIVLEHHDLGPIDMSSEQVATSYGVAVLRYT